MKTDLVHIGKEGGTSHLYIIRSVPGTGKTTYAKRLLNEFKCVEVHLEADMFHETEGFYKFDINRLKDAHAWCLNSTKIFLSQGKRVVVSNTFTTYGELAEYIKFAKKFGHSITLITMGQEYGSIHNVPEETMEKMRNRLEDHNSIRQKIHDENRY